MDGLSVRVIVFAANYAGLPRYDARPPGKQVAHQNNNEPLDILYIAAVLTPYLLSCKSYLLH